MLKIIKVIFFISLIFPALNLFSEDYSTIVQGNDEDVSELLQKALNQSILKVLGSQRDFNLNQKQTELSKIIIDCIDENGMLIEEIFEIEKLSKNIFNSNDIEEILVNVIQKMNPHGIGFRNHKECIKIQIDNKENRLYVNNLSTSNQILLCRIY